MEQSENLARIRRVITIGILVFLALHLALALAMTFSNGRFRPGNSTLANAYDHLVHLGPFYREDAIKSSPHLYVQLNNGPATDLIAAHLNEYRNKPWKLNQLVLRDNARRSGDSFFRSRERSSSRALTKLKAATTNVVQPEIEDKVRWIFLHRYHSIHDNTWKDDTLFNYPAYWK